ncbi:MAG TPA: hypothetical protein VGA34_05480 [Alteraurantiacibacter sp.]
MKTIGLTLRACAAVTILAAAPAPAQEAAQPAARAGGYGKLVALPDWSGVWQPDWSSLFGANGRIPQQPQLTPEAQARVDAFNKKQQEEGVDQSAQVNCLPPGVPGIMRQPYPVEFIYSPGRVTIFAETYSQARRIYTDGRPLPEDPDPFFNGNSVGHWEGDVLVVETNGLHPLTNMIPGLPHTATSTIIERIWLESPERLTIETTIADPASFTEPFTSRQAYIRHRDWQIREYVCEENNRLRSEGGGANIDLGLDDESDPFGPPPSPDGD